MIKWQRFYESKNEDAPHAQQQVCDFLNEHPNIQVVNITEFTTSETDYQIGERGYTLFYNETSEGKSLNNPYKEFKYK